MKVRTENSLYLITGNGKLIQAIKLENEGLKGPVRVGSISVGTHLSLAVGQPMHLTGVQGQGIMTSDVVAIE